MTPPIDDVLQTLRRENQHPSPVRLISKEQDNTTFQHPWKIRVLVEVSTLDLYFVDDGIMLVHNGQKPGILFRNGDDFWERIGSFGINGGTS
jgi:hypothetical protein